MAGGQLSTALRQLRQLLGGRHSVGGSDEQLLQRFLVQRDEEAFAALVHRHGPIVLGVCRRLLTEPSDVEDAFQAVFLILLRKAASIAHPERLGPWLHGVAHRVAVRARLQAARRRASESRVVARAEPDPIATVAWRELRPLLDEEVNRLPERYHVPFILCHLEGKTIEEAAACLDCPKGTVLSRLARARERLRKRLVQRGITLTSAALAVAATENTVSATLPLPLAAATASAAQLRSVGMAATPAALLAKGAINAMFWTQVKGLAFVLLVLGVAGVSAGMLRHWALAGKQIPTQPPIAIAMRPVADEETPPKKPHQAEKKDDPAAERAREEPPPPGAIARLGRLRFQHGEGIRVFAFSPDGKLLASAGYDLDPSKDAKDHTIRLWDVRTGKEVSRLQGNAGDLWSLAFSANGKILAASSSMAEHAVLILWEVASGKQLRQFRESHGHSPMVPVPVAFAPDGNTLAFTGEDGVLRLWDTATAKEVRRLPCKDQVCSLAFSPDGKRLAAGSWNGDLFLWETNSGKAHDTWHASRIRIYALAFSANGKYLATAGETLRLWDTDTEKELLYFDEPLPKRICAMAFSPTASTLATMHWAMGEQSIRLCNIAPGRGHFQTIRFPLQAMPPQRNYYSSLPSLQFSPDGKLLALAAGSDGAIRLWDMARGQERFPPAAVRALAYPRGGGKLISAGEDGSVRFWDAATGTERRSFPAASAVTALTLSHDGKMLATVGEDNTVSLWRTATGKRCRRIRQIDPGWETIKPSKHLVLDPVAALAFSSDDKTLAVVTSHGYSNHIERWTAVVLGLWDTTTGTATRLANPLPRSRSRSVRGAGFHCAFSADGTMLDGWIDGQRFFVDVTSGKGGLMGNEPRLTRAHMAAPKLKEEPQAVALSPDGKLLATGIWSSAPQGKFSKTSVIQLWGAARRELPEHPGFLTALAFSPDAKTVASAAWNVHDPGATLWLWDVASGKEIRHWLGHRGRVNALAFAPDGQHLASASSDGTVLVWKID